MIIRRIINKIKRIAHGLYHPVHVLNQVDNSPTIFYFGVPMHPNLGDLAQCMCIRRFLAQYYPQYKVIEIDSQVFMTSNSTLRQKLKRKIKKEDLIFFQSGYCTQDIGGVEDLMHQVVIQDYPDNKIIVLPQTVYFKTEKRKKQAMQIYNSHKHILFLARDQVSFALAKEMFPNISIYAYPDIVTTLIGSYHFHEERKGILMCTRNDSEKFYSDSELNSLKAKLENINAVAQIDTTIKKPMTANSRDMNLYIENYIKMLAGYRLVITDRYHGTIFSLIANTPVIVIKTTDHKVVTGVDWFKGVYDGSVIYVDDICEVPKVVKELLERGNSIKNDSHFMQEYYSRLPELIKETLG